MLNDVYKPIFNILERESRSPFNAKAIVIVDLAKLTSIRMSDFRDIHGRSIYDYVINTTYDVDVLTTLDEDILSWLVSDFSLNLFGILGWCRLIYARDGLCNESTIPDEIVDYVTSTLSEFIE